VVSQILPRSNRKTNCVTKREMQTNMMMNNNNENMSNIESSQYLNTLQQHHPPQLLITQLTPSHLLPQPTSLLHTPPSAGLILPPPSLQPTSMNGYVNNNIIPSPSSTATTTASLSQQSSIAAIDSPLNDSSASALLAKAEDDLSEEEDQKQSGGYPNTHTVCCIRGCNRKAKRKLSSIRGEPELKEQHSGRVCEAHYRSSLREYKKLNESPGTKSPPPKKRRVSQSSGSSNNSFVGSPSNSSGTQYNGPFLLHNNSSNSFSPIPNQLMLQTPHINTIGGGNMNRDQYGSASPTTPSNESSQDEADQDDTRYISNSFQQQDAVEYVEQIKQVFSDEPHVFNEFASILNDYRKKK
jgi:hypothetical protein